MDDHTIVYLEGGAGPQTIVLLHGFSGNKDNWLRFAPYLKDYHVVIPDLPGQGESSKLISAKYDLSSQVDRLHKFAAGIGIRQFHLVGNSMGPQPRQRVSSGSLPVLLVVLLICGLPLFAAAPGGKITSTWPQAYAVQRHDASGLLTLSTPCYTVQHDPRQGGAIAAIRLTHGRSTNLLIQPIAAHIRDESGTLFTDLGDARARVSHRTQALTEIVTVECRLVDDKGRTSDIQVRTVFEYHWGYIKVRKDFTSPTGSIRVRRPASPAW